MTTSPSLTSGPWSSSPSTKMYPQLILFGDSITQACNQTLLVRLSDDYSRRLDILNRGLSGYNAPAALNTVQHLFPTKPPCSIIPHVRLMTVSFGANDATIVSP